MITKNMKMVGEFFFIPPSIFFSGICKVRERFEHEVAMVCVHYVAYIARIIIQNNKQTIRR